MSLVVVDASVLVAFYAADDPRRPKAVERLSAGRALLAPAHLDAEGISALRGLAQRRSALESAVPAALAHLSEFPIRRMPIAPLLSRMWELRANVTPYDAAYVALAEQLDAALLTCDARLTGVTMARCAFELVG